MFLQENAIALNEETGITSDPMSMVSVLQEATDNWNDICMKMIKLEHTAIVNNDVALLEAGTKEAVGKFIEAVKRLGQKILEFLERVRVQWSKVQAAIQTKFVNQEAVNNLIKKMGNTQIKYTVALPKEYKAALASVNEFSNMSNDVISTCKDVANDLSGGYQSPDYNQALTKQGFKDAKAARLEQKLEKLKWVDSPETQVNLTKQDVQAALTFLKNRATAVKNLETMKKGTTLIMKAEIAKLEKTQKADGKMTLVLYQRAINKLIIGINKATTIAVRICHAVLKTKSGFSEKQISAAKTAGREDRKRAREEKKMSLAEGTSVLDQFA